MSATSRRAEKIFNYLTKQDKPELFIRQATLAEKYGCSCRSIGRALKQLKEEGLLVDLNKRHQNRCKMYRVERVRHCDRELAKREAISSGEIATSAAPPRDDENLGLVGRHCDRELAKREAISSGEIATSAAPPRDDESLTPQAQTQWERYEKTFSLVFRTPDLKIYYAQVTQELSGVTDELELYKKTFAGLWALEA